MTYDASERSAQDGAPVELYLFSRNSREWNYTSSETDVIFDSNTVWTSAPIERNEIEVSNEKARNDLKLRVPRNFEIAELFRVSPPTDVITVAVFRYHRGDEAASAVLWQGRVLNCEWRGSTTATLNCEPISTSVKRVMNRRLQTRGCSLVLYSCGVLKTDHDITTTVTAISGFTITVAALLSKPYAGGFVERVDGDGNIDRRFIRSFSGLVLTLAIPFQDLAVTDSVTVYPGCDQTPTTCIDVYDNYDNFSGLPHFASKNPFSADPIY